MSVYELQTSRCPSLGGSCVQAVDEIKTKQREEYSRISVLSDTLQYEMENQ